MPSRARTTPADTPAEAEDAPTVPGSTRHPLVTKGAWVELRDHTLVRGRDRKAAMAALMKHIKMGSNGKPLPIDAVAAVVGSMDVADAVAVMLVTGWHIPYFADDTLPEANPDLVPDLLAADYDLLGKLVAPAVKFLMPSKVDPSDYANPDSPFVPASG